MGISWGWLLFYLCPSEQAIFLGSLFPFSASWLFLLFFPRLRVLAPSHQCWKDPDTVSCPPCPAGLGSSSPTLALSPMTKKTPRTSPSVGAGSMMSTLPAFLQAACFPCWCSFKPHQLLRWAVNPKALSECLRQRETPLAVAKPLFPLSSFSPSLQSS